MERPLAHLLPEMTANVLGPVCILIYLFVLDWRMALLSLVSIPVGMAFIDLDPGRRRLDTHELRHVQPQAV